MVATKNREIPNASHATGINSTQFCQYVYGKPGALFSVNRLLDAEAQATGSLRLSHRPSDGLEIQNQLICGLPTDGGPPKPVPTCNPSKDSRNRCSPKKWFSA